MSVLRTFIAITLPEEIHQRLDHVSSQLKRHLEGKPVRWVPSGNVHLTLKFLGDVSLSNIDMLTKMMSNELNGQRAFEISIGGLGAYPNARRPRVLWVGVEAPGELDTLHRCIESQVTRLGYAAEKRPFSAHLTLGRVSRNASAQEVRSISQIVQNETVSFLGVARVQEVHLFRSELKSTGAKYTSLFSAPLGGD